MSNTRGGEEIIPFLCVLPLGLEDYTVLCLVLLNKNTTTRFTSFNLSWQTVFCMPSLMLITPLYRLPETCHM